MMKSLMLQGLPTIPEKPEKLHGTGYKTSLVTDDNDEVCGFEVAPCVSDEMLTDPTSPLSARSSETISTNPSEEIRQQQSTDIAAAGVPAVINGSKGNLFESSLLKTRLEELFGVLDDKDEEWSSDDPILELQVEYIEHDEEQEPTPKTITRQIAIRRKAGFNFEKEFFNLLEPSPANTIFTDMLARTHKTLCQVVLGAADVPFLYKKQRKQRSGKVSTKSAKSSTTIPNQNRDLVSMEAQTKHLVSSCGPLIQGKITQLMAMYDHTKKSNATVKSIAYSAGSPSTSETYHVQLDSKKVEPSSRSEADSLNLDSIKLQPNSNGREKGQTCRNLSTPLCKEAKPDVEGTKPIESIVPLAIDENKLDDTDIADLCADEELKAVLKITKGGDEVSPLFPSFSHDTSMDICSDDGLDDELGALDGVYDEIRKDLEFADIVINGSGDDDSVLLKTRLRWKKKMRRKAESELYKLSDTSATTTFSITDSESSQVKSEDSSEDSFQKCRDKRPRRVHFAERHVEISYCADLPILIGPEFADGGPRPKSDPWLNNLEDAYNMFEDIMDDLALSCTNYVKRNLKQPSSTRSRNQGN